MRQFPGEEGRGATRPPSDVGMTQEGLEPDILYSASVVRIYRLRVTSRKGKGEAIQEPRTPPFPPDFPSLCDFFVACALCGIEPSPPPPRVGR